MLIIEVGGIKLQSNALKNTQNSQLWYEKHQYSKDKVTLNEVGYSQISNQ